jgi:lipopolysaccharide export system permease protein
VFSILRRAVFFELVKVFVPSFISIMGIIVIAGVVTEAMRQGLGPGQVLAAIPLIMPSMLPFIVPPTTLFATCVVYGRLAHDNEITAIRSSGINIMHVIWPALFLGLAMSLTTFGLYYYVIPHTQHLLRTAIINDCEEYLYAQLRKDGEIKPRPDFKIEYEMYVKQVQGRLLKDALFYQRDKQGQIDLIVKAKEAELHVDMERKVVVVSMRICSVFGANGQGNGLFNDKDVDVPLPAMDSRKVTPRDLTWEGISAEKEKIQREKEETLLKLAINNSEASLANGPPEAAAQVQFLSHVLHEEDSKLLALDTEVQMRPALSFGCFFFVLIGCPIGIWFSRSDYLSAFITCFLPIVVVYYPIQLCSTNLAKEGRIDPIIALWSANAILGIAALLLFRKLLKN